jgi:hypothetical protein
MGFKLVFLEAQRASIENVLLKLRGKYNNEPRINEYINNWEDKLAKIKTKISIEKMKQR